jgi:uncharacterized protein YggE
MEKERLITVKGIGKMTVPVDYVEIKFTLEEINKDYKKGYETFESNILELQKFVQSIGFKKEDLKASEINVTPEYDSIRKNNKYIDVFKGYNFITELKLCFDFDSKKLGEVFSLSSTTKCTPKIDVEFTVKDKEAIKKKLLANAAKDAREKANILCEAMGVKLGNLITINYNWTDINIHSYTNYKLDNMITTGLCCREESLVDFTPDDISVNDDASFIWEITD